MPSCRPMLGVALTLMCAQLGVAQEAEHHHPAAPDRSWTWTADGAVFAVYNDQERKFTDFRVVESQNWFMLQGSRPVGAGRLTLLGMASLEPFTLEKLGSPQVFQTGETYKGAPL